MRHRALYAAFDRVPSAKGAAIHIAHAVRALERAAGNTLLACVADGRLPEGEREGGIEVMRLGAGAPDLVERVRAYRRSLAGILEAQRGSLRVCHFRDPWSGIPILDASRAYRQRGGSRFATVYEVNGLPSIEMPYRFPSISARTLDRIRAMERRCLAEADHILTPAATLARNLERMGVAPARITVIPNGADLPSRRMRRPPGAPKRYFLYFGALQPWPLAIVIDYVLTPLNLGGKTFPSWIQPWIPTSCPSATTRRCWPTTRTTAWTSRARSSTVSPSSGSNR